MEGDKMDPIVDLRNTCEDLDVEFEVLPVVDVKGHIEGIGNLVESSGLGISASAVDDFVDGGLL